MGVYKMQKVLHHPRRMEEVGPYALSVQKVNQSGQVEALVPPSQVVATGGWQTPQGRSLGKPRPYPCYRGRAAQLALHRVRENGKAANGSWHQLYGDAGLWDLQVLAAKPEKARGSQGR
jgi:hypothetical protein